MSKPASHLIMIPIASLSILCTAACGSIANGSSQKIPVVSMPAGAAVIADCGKGPKPAGETPVVVKVSRKADRCLITVKKDGYAEESVVLKRRLSGWVWGNLFLPYVTVPGFLIDLYDGGAYRRTPELVEVRLREEAAEEPVAP